MKTKVFEVPSELLPEFSGLLAELELVNEIQGTNDDDEIIVEVSYGTKQKEAIKELSDWLDEALEDFYEDDDEEDDDEDSDED
jgi:DNA-binding MarR family transcriptional regulator